MKPATIRLWSAIHKWTSLIPTLFLLMLCITGLPLIFHDEIDDALNPDDWQAANPGAPLLDLDTILDRALENRPGEVPLYMSFDIDRPVINVTTGPTPDAPGTLMHFASFDATSGDLVPPKTGGAFMEVILQLHTDMFLGLPGMLFLGAMGALMIVAIVSGVVLYTPFMRKLDFGTVRASRKPRIKWLDFHNLLGIVTVAWLTVVGLTGVINTLEAPIIDTWKYNELADLTAGYEAGAVPAPAGMASLDTAVRDAQEAAPGMQLQFVAFPGGDFSTSHHYAVFFHGSTPLTEQLITPALIDARTGALAGIRPMPWYAKALSLSRPLHFGDYGGLPLKILWFVLDLMTIVVLGTGIYLWLTRRKSVPAEVREIRELEGKPT
ncbi:PepSY-associated TM helix domain-containing protein [Aquisalinus flavus]|uniref:Peptidase n=1 Tax=Aquisalinus flavus TaxID=1526572 RepID=A0A8J2Y5X6_9PROT|nr:PepSY domain-containing protein [Aquisalinus flavus]MBD0426799.1 PepSY domain-containing protein [Aquisalinus flavus]UNE46649.1 PepSY domain-containing protein [Aquisalinus flavus]GGC96097.1 peptidase [Aquisalinus flavus]